MNEKEKSNNLYDEDKIKTLTSIEHIRKCPGMYIGRIGDGSSPDDGIYVLLKEVVDNSIDEYIMGHGARIDIEVNGKQVSVRDYGRGIPQGKLVECVSHINTGAKYNTDVFQFSVGLNGVGTKAVNALSEKFQVSSIRDGTYRTVIFEHGVLKEDQRGSSVEADGTCIVFTPDRTIFPNYEFITEYLEKKLWLYAFLNSGLSLCLNGIKYSSENGLHDLLEKEVADSNVYKIIHVKDKMLEFAFCHSSNYTEQYFSFVNGQYTSDGGTHLVAFKEGILKAINEYSKKSFQSIDVRDGMTGAIAIKVQSPVFESPTKTKLGNTDLRSWIVGAVKNSIVDYMHKHTDEAKLIIGKVTSNEAVRKEIQTVQKQFKNIGRKKTLSVPNLKDCKVHYGDKSPLAGESTLFITEGKSAAGSMISSRDVHTQAIFPLRGKLLNSFKVKLSKIYDNAELHCIIQALGIEKNMDSLRYAKIVIATDADKDGLHIRNLLITFFLMYSPQLVKNGHLYILETPLYRVRNKSEIIYCYDLKERDEALEKIKAHSRGAVEITRFKGLGEISPVEFGQFIGRQIRLLPVPVSDINSLPQLLSFYLGDNTKERHDYIVKNLI